ncbi:Fe(2+) transporter [Terramyces sp. JEL0728]|nr:Fe(2+) transporter [Terramyces sp. JEL0728]
MCQDNDDYESLPTTSLALNMVAGAVAGITEHTVTYPFDVLKTRMQFQHSIYQTVTQSMSRIYTTEGLSSLWRGINSVILGAGPAHALYFGTYEIGKKVFRPFDKSEDHHLVHAGAGALATIAHDGFNTPFDVVKQRMQISTQYRGIYDCASTVYRAEGINAFYISFPTTLMMNIPFQMIQFTTYEYMCKRLNPTDTYNPLSHCMSGACAGAAAAFFTNPLDVAKTALQTRGLATGRFRNVTGLFDSFKLIYQRDGMVGFARGTQARMLSHIPSTAVAWTTIRVNNKFTFVLDGFVAVEELQTFKNLVILESEEFDSIAEILNASNTLVLRDKPNTKMFCFNNTLGFDLISLENEFSTYDVSLEQKLELYSLYKAKYSEYHFGLTSSEQTIVKLNILPIKHSSCLSILEFMEIYHSEIHDLFLTKLAGTLPKNDLVVVLRISQDSYRLSETLHLLEIGQRIRLGYLGFDKLEMEENYGMDTSKYLLGRSSRMSEYFDIPEFTPDSLDELHSRILEKVNKEQEIADEQEVEHTVNNPLLDPSYMAMDESLELPLKDTSYPKLLSINHDSVIHDYEPNSEILLQETLPRSLNADLKAENERLVSQVQYLKNELLLFKSSVVENALKSTSHSTFDDVSDLTIESTKDYSRLELELALQEMTRVAKHFMNKSDDQSIADQEIHKNVTAVPVTEVSMTDLQAQNKHLSVALEAKSKASLDLENKIRIMRDKYHAKDAEFEKERLHNEKQKMKMDRALENIKQLQDQLIIQNTNASISVETVLVPNDFHSPDTTQEITDFVDLQRTFEEACLEHQIKEQQVFIINQWLVADSMITASKYANNIQQCEQLASENTKWYNENVVLNEKVQALEIQNVHLEQSQASMSKTVENYKEAFRALKEKENSVVGSRDVVSRIPVSRFTNGRNSPTLSNVSEDSVSVLTVASAPAYYKTPKMQERIAERVRTFTEISDRIRDTNIPVPKHRERHSLDSGMISRTQNLVQQKHFQDQLTHEWVSRESENIADQLYIAKATIQALEQKIVAASKEITELKELGVRSTQSAEELNDLTNLNQENQQKIEFLQSEIKRLESELYAERKIKRELEEHLTIFEKEMMAVLEKQVKSIECQTDESDLPRLEVMSRETQIAIPCVEVEAQTDPDKLLNELEMQKVRYQNELQSLADLEAINKQMLVSANQRFDLERTNLQEQVHVLTVECDSSRKKIDNLTNDRVKLQEKYDVLFAKNHIHDNVRSVEIAPEEISDQEDENQSLLGTRDLVPVKDDSKSVSDGQLKQLEQRLAVANNNQFELKSKVAELEKKLDANAQEYEKERNGLLQATAGLNAKNDRLDQKLSQVEQNYQKYLDETQPRLKNMKYDLDSLREVYSETKGLLDNTKDDLEVLMVENSSLKLKYAELEAVNGHQRSTLSDLDTELEICYQKIKNLEKDLKNATTSIDSLQLMIASQNYQDQISALKSELQKCQSDYNQAIVLSHWNLGHAQIQASEVHDTTTVKAAQASESSDFIRKQRQLGVDYTHDDNVAPDMLVERPLSRALTSTGDNETSYVTADSGVLDSQVGLQEKIDVLQEQIQALHVANSKLDQEIINSNWLLGEIGIQNVRYNEQEALVNDLKPQTDGLKQLLASRMDSITNLKNKLSQKEVAFAWNFAQHIIDNNRQVCSAQKELDDALVQKENDFALLAAIAFVFISLVFGTQSGVNAPEPRPRNNQEVTLKANDDQILIEKLWNLGERGIMMQKLTLLQNNFDRLSAIHGVAKRDIEADTHSTEELKKNQPKIQELDGQAKEQNNDTRILDSVEQYILDMESKMESLELSVEKYHHLKATEKEDFNSIVHLLNILEKSLSVDNFKVNSTVPGRIAIIINEIERKKMKLEDSSKILEEELSRRTSMLDLSENKYMDVCAKYDKVISDQDSSFSQLYITNIWNLASVEILNSQIVENGNNRSTLEKQRESLDKELADTISAYESYILQHKQSSDQQEQIMRANSEILNSWNQASTLILNSRGKEYATNIAHSENTARDLVDTRHNQNTSRDTLLIDSKDMDQLHIINCWNQCCIEILNQKIAELSKKNDHLHETKIAADYELSKHQKLSKDMSKKHQDLIIHYQTVALVKDKDISQQYIQSIWQQASLEILRQEFHALSNENSASLASDLGQPSSTDEVQTAEKSQKSIDSLAILEKELSLPSSDTNSKPRDSVLENIQPNTMDKEQLANLFIQKCWLQGEIGILHCDMQNLADFDLDQLHIPRLDISSFNSEDIFLVDTSGQTRSILNTVPGIASSDSNLNSIINNTSDDTESVFWPTVSDFWRSHQLHAEHKMETKILTDSNSVLTSQLYSVIERNQVYHNSEQDLKQELNALRNQHEKESTRNISRQYSNEILGMRMEVDNMRMDLGKANIQILKSKKYIRELEGVSKNLRQELKEWGLQNEQKYVEWAWMYAEVQIQISDYLNDSQAASKVNLWENTDDIIPKGLSTETLAMLKSIDQYDFNAREIKIDDLQNPIPPRSIVYQDNTFKLQMDKFAEYFQLLLDNVQVLPEKKAILEKLTFKIQDMFNKQSRRLQKKNDIHKRAMAELDSLQTLSNSQKLENLLKLYRYYIVQVALDRDRVLNRLKRVNLMQIAQKSTNRSIHKSASVQYIGISRRLSYQSNLQLRRFSSVRVTGDSKELEIKMDNPLGRARKADVPKMTTIPEDSVPEIPPYMVEVQGIAQTKKLQSRMASLQEQIKRDHFVIEQLKADLGYYLPLGNYSTMFAKVRRQVDDQRKVIAMLESKLFDLAYGTLESNKLARPENSQINKENNKGKPEMQTPLLDGKHAEVYNSQKSPISDTTVRDLKTPTIRDIKALTAKTPTLKDQTGDINTLAVESKIGKDCVVPESHPLYRKSGVEAVERSNTITTFDFSDSEWYEVLPTLEYGGIVENITLFPPKKKAFKTTREVSQQLPPSLVAELANPIPQETIPSPPTSLISVPPQQDVVSATSTPTILSDVTSLANLKHNLVKLAKDNRQSSASESTKVNDRLASPLKSEIGQPQNRVIINDSLQRVNESLQRRNNIMNQKYQSSFPSDNNVPNQVAARTLTEPKLPKVSRMSGLRRKFSFE